MIDLLRSDAAGVLARDGMFDADSEGVTETFDAVSSFGSHVRRLAKCACSSLSSLEAVREGNDCLGPPVRRRLDLRSPTGT